MKLTKKQIDIIIEKTPEELKGFHHSFTTDFGYYRKSNANWSYLVGYVKHNDTEVLVVKVYGKIQ